MIQKTGNTEKMAFMIAEGATEAPGGKDEKVCRRFGRRTAELMKRIYQ